MSSASSTTSDAAEIMRLHYMEGLSIRAIARRLRVSRKTVRQRLGLLPARNDKKTRRRPSLLEAYEPMLLEWLRKTPELTATQLLESLRKHGYRGGISILRDRLRHLRPLPNPKPYLTVIHHPGETMQVDWADFGFALPGVPRRVSAFVVLLPYSKLLLIEFVLSQAMGSFLRCMDRAIARLGGVTNADVFDNMKTVVLENRPGVPPQFNTRFLAYANARGGFAVIACTPGYPQGKGGVERGVRTAREGFWPGRRFRDLGDLNWQADDWCSRVHNQRPNVTTSKVPALVFDHDEKQYLKPIPEQPFDTDDISHDTVNSSFRVRFDRNTYSVPWHLHGQRVTVRASEEHVRVFVGPKSVAEHRRSWDIGIDIEDPEHPRQLRAIRQAKPKDALVARFGEAGDAYFNTLSAGCRSLRRELLRLTYLAELFGNEHTRAAMISVMKTGHVGVEYVEYVLRHKQKLQPQFTPLKLGNPSLDNIVLSEPDLTIYDPPNVTRDPGEDPS
jgi:transposase